MTADIVDQAANETLWPQKRVRLARMPDIPHLMRHCRRLNEENGIVQMKDELVQAEITNAIARRLAVLAVVGDDDRIEGSICLRCNHYWYNDEFWWLEDRWCFVEPEFRASSNAKELLEFAQWWADQLSIPLMMGVVSNERTKSKIRLYERMFGPQVGALWLVGARTGVHD